MLTNSSNALVLGASGAIGQALIQNFLNDNQIGRVIAVSRSAATFHHPKLHWVSTQYDEPSMQAVVDGLSEYKGSFSKVCICHGILHGEKMFPEKRMEEMSVDMMQSPARFDCHLRNSESAPDLWHHWHPTLMR